MCTYWSPFKVWISVWVLKPKHYYELIMDVIKVHKDNQVEFRLKCKWLAVHTRYYYCVTSYLRLVLDVNFVISSLTYLNMLNQFNYKFFSTEMGGNETSIFSEWVEKDVQKPTSKKGEQEISLKWIIDWRSLRMQQKQCEK